MTFLEKKETMTHRGDLEYKEEPVECPECRRWQNLAKKFYNTKPINSDLKLNYRVRPLDKEENRLMITYNMYNFTCHDCGHRFFKCVWKNTDIIGGYLR